MLKKIYITFVFLVLAILFISCSTIRQINPLSKGESSLTLSIGGPITQVGKTYIPLPLLSMGYNYGILDNLSIESGLNFLSAAYGVLHLDIGANYWLFFPKKIIPGIIISPQTFILTNFTSNGFRLYPDIGLTTYWEIKQNKYVYIGIDNWFEYHSYREDGNIQKHHWLITPYLGINMGNKKWQGQAEIKWYVPNLVNNTRAIKNIGIGNYGVVGIFLGINRTFGEIKK